MNPWINANGLIEAFRQKWVEEHPMYDDTGGGMTYNEIIDFIRKYAERMNGLMAVKTISH